MRYRFKRYIQHLKSVLHQIWRNGAWCYLMAGLVLIPVWFSPQFQLNSVVQDTLFVIDISESMNVRDVDYPKPQTSRLALAKLTVRDAMASLPCGSRVSLALFAGDESVVLFEPLEICRHFPAIEQVVSRLDSRMRWIGDSWMVRALVASIKEAKKRQLNVVMLTDGDEMPHHSAPRLTELIDLKGKVKGLLLGFGGEAPQPVPRLDGRNQIIGYWTQEEAVLEGNHPNLLAYVKTLQAGEKAPAGMLDEVGEHLSAYNRPFMQDVAQASLMRLQHVNNPQDAVQALQDAQFQKQAYAERDARWIFALIGILLILIAWFWQAIFK